MQYRFSPGTFLGYSSQYKGYKVLLPDKRVIISRHVLFDENVFPFASNQSGNSLQYHIHSPPSLIGPPIAIQPNSTSSSDTHQFDNQQIPSTHDQLSSSASPAQNLETNSDHSFSTIPLIVQLPNMSDVSSLPVDNNIVQPSPT